MPHDTHEASASSRRTARRARRLAAGVLIVATVAVHGSLWSIGGVPESRPLWGDEKMYWNGAARLNAGEAWHPPPLWPPLYPRFLAAILAGGGSTAAARAAQTLMLLAVALLWRDLTRHLTGSRLAGDVAGALTLIYPPLAAFAHYFWPEVIHLLWFSGALWILVRKSDRPPWLLAAGALLGLALLTKSLLGPFLPLMLLALVVKVEGSIRDRVFRVLLVAAAMGAVIVPTAVSNHRRGTGVVIANSVAFNLWVGLNERSKKTFVDPVAFPVFQAYHASAPTYPERDAILWDKIRALVDERGVFAVLRRQIGRQYFRLFDRDSYLTDMLPGGAVTARGRGYRGPPPAVANGLRATSYLLYAAILAGAAAGIAVCPTSRRRWLVIGVLFIAYNLGVFLLLHAKSRFRVPLLPFLFLYSGCAAAWAAHRLGLNPDEAELWSAAAGGAKWWAAALAALLLLFLAFGR